jgi:hypothetical protein
MERDDTTSSVTTLPRGDSILTVYLENNERWQLRSLGGQGVGNLRRSA